MSTVRANALTDASGTSGPTLTYGASVQGGVSSSIDDDGTFSSGSYTPALSGGNFKNITNSGAFTLNAPGGGTSIAYTMVVAITNSATAGAVTLAGFQKTGGDPFTTTNGHAFLVFVTSFGNLKSAMVQALQ